MVTDLSGVLQERKIVKVVDKKGKTLRHEERPLFTVSENGSISVESMRGTKHYAFAQECDSEIKNNLLQGSEIRKFLSKFNQNDIRTNTDDLVYYQEKNTQGVVTKICTLSQNANAEYTDQQMVFNYDNGGNLRQQILYQTPGMKFEGTYIYDSYNNKVTAYKDDGEIFINRSMKLKNYNNMNQTSDIVKNQEERTLSKFFRWINSKLK